MRSNTLGARRAWVAPVDVSVSWPAVYLSATFIAWTISPFLRRLLDWKTHFSAISPLAALPIIMLVPAAVMLLGGRARPISRTFELLAVIWMIGFGYALTVAVLVGHVLGGLYTFASFCLPVAFALWVATRPEDTDFWYRRISGTAIRLALIVAFYGILQYVYPLPWDVAWMKSISIENPTFGSPLPFQVRVFSTLNAPATFAGFLTLGYILFLPRMTLKSGLLLMPIFIGLGLTSVRTYWVTLPLAILVYALFASRRAQLFKGIATFFGVGVLVVALAQVFLTVGVSTTFQNRLLTLTDISHDASAANRAVQMAAAYEVGTNDPQGSGLGYVGIATRLNSAQQEASNLDSGYLARFVEMGFLGASAFIASLSLALFAALRVWRDAVRAADKKQQDLAAMAISMQVAILVLNFFGDASTGLVAVMSWSSLGLILRCPVRDAGAR
jgi:putative inorganic carbon (HCO3(-)) transporter